MANKQPNRQRIQPKVYTDSDFRKALRDAVYNVGIQNMKINIATFALVLHRKLGMDKDAIMDVLNETSRLTDEALCYTDVRKQVLEETGLDIADYVEDEKF